MQSIISIYTKNIRREGECEKKRKKDEGGEEMRRKWGNGEERGRIDEGEEG